MKKSLLHFFLAGTSAKNLYDLLFWAAFEQDDASPVATPLKVYSGQDVNFTQTASNLSIINNNLVKTGASGSFTNYMQGSGITRAIGLCIGFKVYYTGTGRFILGWKLTGGSYIYLQSSSNLLSFIDQYAGHSLNIPTIANQNYHVFIIARTNGAYFILNINDLFYLVGISSIEGLTALTEYIDLSSNTTYVDWCREKQLTSITGNWDLATYSNTDIANSTVFTHPSDCWIVFRLQTKASSGNSEIRFRIQDANNYLKLTIDSTNNGRLYETVAGVDTQLGATVTMAHLTEYKIFLNGTSIRIFGADSTALKITGTSANFTSETDGELVTQGTGGNITYFYTLPYNIASLSLINELLGIIAIPEPTGVVNVQTLYVSTSGSGVGTLANPMSLTAAIAAAGPGTTIILRAGTYTHDLSAINIFGTQNYPLKIKPYTNERVILQAATHFKLFGNDVVFDGKDGWLEILSTGWNLGFDRFLSSEAFAFDVFGQRSKILNAVIHDFGNIGFWVTNVDGVMQGCLTYNIGQGNGSQGHSFYTQNASGGIKTVRDNIWAKTYDTLYDVHQYGSGAADVKGYRYNQCILVKSTFLTGSASSLVDDTEITDCYVIEGNFAVGLLGITDPEHRVIFNRVRTDKGRLLIKKSTGSQVNDSKFVNTVDHAIEINNDTDLQMNNNQYITYGTTGGGGTLPYYFAYENTNGYITMALWRAATGYDAASTLTQYADTVPPDEVVILPHQDDTKRAGVIVYNYSNALTVEINLSTVTGLQIGEDYSLLNSQNPSETFDFTYDGDAITVPMTGWTVATPVGTGGGAMTPITSIFPTYGVFYLMKAI